MVSHSQHNALQIPFLKRQTALDALRGIVMVLMALDHVSHVFNAERYVTDSAAWYVTGSEIPAAQFLLRWATHICAPTFLFLAGLVMALSVARRQIIGESSRAIDGFILKGAFSFFCSIRFG